MSADTNGQLRFTDVFVRTSRNDTLPKEKSIWKCPTHGEFTASFMQVYGALKKGKGNIGCPYCHGTKVRKEDSFAVRYPELAEEWADENDVSPYEVSVGSQKEMLWQCAAGHKWYARIEINIILRKCTRN